jgi:hypothetical protein
METSSAIRASMEAEGTEFKHRRDVAAEAAEDAQKERPTKKKKGTKIEILL